MSNITAFDISQTVQRKLDRALLSEDERAIMKANAGLVVEVADAMGTAFHTDNTRAAVDVNTYVRQSLPGIREEKQAIIEKMKDLDSASAAYKAYEDDLNALNALTQNATALTQSVSARLKPKAQS